MSAVFSPDGQYLVCGSDSGRIAVWDLRQYMNENSWKSSSPPDLTPDMSFSAGDGAINCVVFVGSGAGTSLLCGADTSAMSWPWSKLLVCLDTGAEPPRPEVVFKAPQTEGKRGSMQPLAEINALSKRWEEEAVLGAAGDCSGHEWDLTTGRLKRSYKGHTAYLHCIQCVANSPCTVVTGADNGVVGVWDTRAENPVELMQPLQSAKSAGLWERPVTGGAWVSSLDVDPAGDLLACGGGLGGNAGGWLSLIHLPTRTTISAAPVPSGAVQAIVHSDDSLLTVGSEPILSTWSWSQLKVRSRTKTTAPSGFAVAVAPEGNNEGVVAVAGRSPAVDVYAYPGVIAFSLEFR